jgi:hypothetical protein
VPGALAAAKGGTEYTYYMDSVVRNVSDLSTDERHVYESVLGQPLRADQRVLVQLTDAGNAQPSPAAINGSGELTAWYTIWADLSDAEIRELESAVLQRSESRPN